jgi:ElaB/YqjD/DUF883 family membrane-anchored ribosome-binding protein
MNSDNLEGKVANGLGRMESAAGELADDPKLKVKGEARQFQGKAQDAVGTAKDTLASAADQVGSMMAKATDDARDAYEAARARAQDVVETIDPFVRERPYATLALAAFAGLVIGALCLNRGSRVVYVKPARS